MTNTTIEQFKMSLLNPVARQSLGLHFDEEEAAWIALDDERLAGAYAAWRGGILSASLPRGGDGTASGATGVLTDGAAPRGPAQRPVQMSASHDQVDYRNTPGRISGFTFSLISALFATFPIGCLPLAITGIVLSARALRRIPAGGRGRPLAQWGLGLGIAALSITALLVFLAVPGAIERNFG